MLDEEALIAWGRRVGAAAHANAVFVCLFGELGAGKSTLARAACGGAGIEGPIPSPTFTLLNMYTARDGRPFVHGDLYRLERPAQLWDLGWDDLLAADGAVFIEWAERAGSTVPADRWEIRLEMTTDPCHREVVAASLGSAPPCPEPL